MKRIQDSPAAGSLAVYVIQDRKGNIAGKVLALYAQSRAVTVEVHDFTSGKHVVTSGKAGGGGYDKFTAALAGQSFAGIKFRDHSETAKGSLPHKAVSHANAVKSDDPRAKYKHNGRSYASRHYVSGLKLLEAYGYHATKVL